MFAAVPEEQAIATIDRAWELGIRLFDTAPVYGYGLSEQRAGLALRGRPRSDFVLCSKVGRLIEPGGPDIQPIWAEPPAGLGPRLDYSYAAVLRSFEESLARMGIDRIDILHIHDPELDFPTASTEAYQALTDLRDRGTIGALSLGVNHADAAAAFIRATAGTTGQGPDFTHTTAGATARGPDFIRATAGGTRRGPDCILLAGRYTLLDQSAADDLLPLCEALGIPILAAGVFQGGALTDPARGAALPTVSLQLTSAFTSRVEALRTLCRRYGVPLLAAAVQFPLRHPAVPAVVVGARTPREITEVAKLLEVEIPVDFWAALARDGLIPARADAG
jgi:D-threo-aldose 1-dehydrogenase